MKLRNCKIYDEQSEQERLVDIEFTDKIAKITEATSTDVASVSYKLSDLTSGLIDDINSEKIVCDIDLEGLIVVPGGIDPHVHFDTPGFTDREDFFHGSCSAAKGGVTTIIDMPCTSIPPVTSGNNFDEKMKAIVGESVIDFALFGGIDCRDFANMDIHLAELKSRGVRGIKTYFISGMETYPRITKLQFYRLAQAVKEYNLPLLVHAEDYELITDLQEVVADLPDDAIKYTMSRPRLAEALAVASAVEIALVFDTALHIVHVGSSTAADIINRVNSNSITYETCPHYLAFNYKDFETKGSSLKTAPGVKTAEDSDKLWNYLIEGNCSFIASDHAPAPDEQKNTGRFSLDYGGIPGTQTMIPYLISEGLNKRNLSLKRFVEITSKNAAIKYNLYPNKGSLQRYTDADFTIIDLAGKSVFKGEELLSKGHITPFANEVFFGSVAMTMVRGKIVFEKRSGITGRKGFGAYIS